MNITSHELQPNHSTKTNPDKKKKKKKNKPKKTQLKEMKQETSEVDNTGAGYDC